MKRQMTPKDVVPYLTRWLSTPVPPGSSVLVYAAHRTAAVDAARALVKEIHGQFSTVEVPEDTVPLVIENVTTGLRVFFVTQPSHFPTVVFSQKAEPMSIWRARFSGLDPSFSSGLTVFDKVDKTDLIGAAAPSDELYYNMRDAGVEPPKVRKPLCVIVDAEAPQWAEISQLVGNNTKLLQTTRVPGSKTFHAFRAEIEGKASFLIKELT